MSLSLNLWKSGAQPTHLVQLLRCHNFLFKQVLPLKGLSGVAYSQFSTANPTNANASLMNSGLTNPNWRSLRGWQLQPARSYSVALEEVSEPRQLKTRTKKDSIKDDFIKEKFIKPERVVLDQKEKDLFTKETEKAKEKEKGKNREEKKEENKEKEIHVLDAKVDKEPDFGDFSLNQKLLKRLKEIGYEKPFPIQSATFPYTLVGKDVIARAYTGSGKTLAFTLPIIQKLAYSDTNNTRNKTGSISPRAIILSPTRELGLQIFNEIDKIADQIKCLAVYGGTSIESQVRTLRKGVDVVIGTPGRVNDLIERQSLNLSNIQFFVLDEADQMMGADFRPQVEAILAETPKSRQTILFSATMPRSVKDLTRDFMNDPEVVDLLEEGVKVPETVKHFGIPMRMNQSRFKAIGDLILMRAPKKGIIFTNRKIESTKLSLYLTSRNISCEALHSDLTQGQREKTMQRFRNGELQVVIATDVAARGIDVPDCDLVLQIEPPNNGFEYYIHRSGRTGRAGKDGTSIVLYSRNERDFLASLVQTGIHLQNMTLPKEEEIISLSVKNQTEKMSSISPALIEKVVPIVTELHNKEGVQALAKAMVLAANYQSSNEFEEEMMAEDNRSNQNRFSRGNFSDRSNQGRFGSSRSSNNDRFGSSRSSNNDRFGDYPRKRDGNSGSGNYGGGKSGDFSRKRDSGFESAGSYGNSKSPRFGAPRTERR